MKKKIITVSREFGSGGRTLGKMLAEQLQWKYYDKEIVDKVADETGFDPGYISERGEYAPGKNKLSYAFTAAGTPGIMQGMSAADFLWYIQNNVIRQIADADEPAIIVGRSADYILKDREDAMHIFVCADRQWRADRIVRVYGESEKAPLRRVDEKDKKRKTNYNYYTGREWGDPANYDLCLNTGRLGIEACVEMVIAALKAEEQE